MDIQRHIYLDTSSLRSVGRRLAQIKGLSGSFTSAFSFVELLNGIRKDERNFARKAATIRYVTRFQLAIDWALPEARLAGAFDNLEFDEKRSDSLRSIIEAVVESNSLPSFEENLSGLQIQYPIEFFEEYDDEFSRYYVEYSNNAYRELRDDYRAYRAQLQQIHLLKDTLPESYKEFVTSLRSDKDVWRQLNLATQLGMAQRLCADLEVEPTTEEVIEVCASYNGSLDVFVEADCHKMLTDLAATNSVGRNDPADVAHFLYVTPATLFVSEDNDHREMAEGIGLKNCSVADLIVD